MVSVLGTTSCAGGKLKSSPSDVKILNCHTFILYSLSTGAFFVTQFVVGAAELMIT